MRSHHALAALLAAALPAAPAAAHRFVQAEGHLAVFGEALERDFVPRSFGGAVKGGYRFGRWGAFLQLEANAWTDELASDRSFQGALDIGVGGEVLFAGDRLRTSLALGPSVLLRSTELDEAGTTGLFVDFRPLGVRWPLGDGFHIGVDPLSFALLMPVLDGIPLVEIQYRTIVAGEYQF